MSFKDFTADVKFRMQEGEIKKQKLKLNKKKEKKNKSCPSCKNHRNMIVNSIFFILLTTITGMILLHYLQLDIRHLQSTVTDKYTKISVETVINTKKYVDAISTAELKDISNSITDEIYSTMDMEELEKQMNNGIIPKELDNIFRRNIINKSTVSGLDPYKNNIFICNNNGILADYSITRAVDNDVTRTWEVESSSQENSDLFNNSIRSLLKQDNRQIFVEEPVIEGEDHVVLPKMTERDLIGIYKKEGLDGLKNYSFLVPVYVLENNDIFGVNDIIDGHRVENNKFIIVQRYNLYDYIMMYNIDEALSDNTEFEFTSIYYLLNIFIIIYIVSIIIYIFYSISILNHAIDGQERECNDQRRNNNVEITDPYNMTGRRAYDKYSAEIIRLLQEEREKEYKEAQEKESKQS